MKNKHSLKFHERVQQTIFLFNCQPLRYIIIKILFKNVLWKEKRFFRVVTLAALANYVSQTWQQNTCETTAYPCFYADSNNPVEDIILYDVPINVVLLFQQQINLCCFVTQQSSSYTNRSQDAIILKSNKLHETYLWYNILGIQLTNWLTNLNLCSDVFETACFKTVTRMPNRTWFIIFYKFCVNS